MSLSLLLLLLVTTTCLLPFVLIKSSPPDSRKWPRGLSFWLTAAFAVTISILTFYSFLLAIGESNNVGFGESAPPPLLSSLAQSLLMSCFLGFAWFGILLGIWKISKTPPIWRAVILLFADSYCLAIILAGYFRTCAAEHITNALF
jgi:hypothetical protein